MVDAILFSSLEGTESISERRHKELTVTFNFTINMSECREARSMILETSIVGYRVCMVSLSVLSLDPSQWTGTRLLSR